MLAIALVWAAAACSGDDDTAGDDTSEDTSTTTVPDPGDGPPRINEDHWHAAYGIWACDRFVDPLQEAGEDLLGIHTHNDGLIHVHPYVPETAGTNAVLGRFADQVALELDDGSFTLPAGETFATGDDCDGEAGEVVVIEWPDGGDPSTSIVHTDDLRSVRLADGAAYTIAFMAPGADPEALYPPTAPVPPNLPDTDPGGSTTFPSIELPDGACPDGLPRGTGPVVEGSVQFRPVLLALPPVCDAGLPADPNGMQYVLGEALPDGMVDSAEAIIDPMSDSWAVIPTFNQGSPGIDDLNAMAAECFDMTTSCPTGQLAIVFDGDVIMAPSISQPSYEIDSIQISGDFSEAQARELAAAFSP